MKILIVEDNRQMRQIIRAIVADLAEEVTECADGAEAVAAYAAQQFSGDDRVLMDLQMPGGGGLEATRRIRAAFPDAQIIIVTQYDDQHWRTAATEAGACGYLLKENLLELRLLLRALSYSLLTWCSTPNERRQIMIAKMAGPTNEEINAAVQSITNLRAWIIELYEDTRTYENLAFVALNSTTKTTGWSNFLVNTVINLATGIIDATAIASGQPLVVPAVGFLSAEIKEWINGGNRPPNLTPVFVEYALSHLAMQEAMENKLAHYIDATDDHANLRTAWDKTFQVQGTTYKLSDLAKPQHAFPGIGDLWSATKATAATEFQKRLWNLIIIKTCTFGALNSEFHTTSATEGSASLNELADYVRQVRYTNNPGVYARRNLTSKDQEGVTYEIYYWTLGLGGNEFPQAVCDMLFRDDTVGHIIRPDALFPRDYVFKQFSPTKPDFRQGIDSNWKEIPNGNNDWVFTGGYFPELTKN